MCSFSTLPNSTAGRAFLLQDLRGQALLPDYTAEALAGASNFFCGGGGTKLYGGRDFYYKTVRGQELFTRLRGGGPPGVRVSNLVGGKMGDFCHPPFF